MDGVKYFLAYGNLVVAIGALGVGFLVISKNWHDRAKQAYFIFTTAVGLYALLYWPMVMSGTAQQWIFWFRIMCLPVVFIAIGNTHFVLEWLGIAQRHRLFLILIYAFGFIILPFIFTSLFLVRLVRVSWGYSFIGGAAFYIWMSSYIILWMVAFFTLIRYYPSLSLIRKKQAQLFFIGNVIGAICGLPNFTCLGNITPQFPPLTTPFIILYVVLTGYAIIRYRAMEIDTVIHKTVLWLISISFLVLPVGIIYGLFREWLAVLSMAKVTALVSATLLVFLWYYQHLKPRIDHFFRRRKYDYQTILGKVAEKIATTISIEDLTRQLLNEVCETMYLRNGVLLLLSRDGSRYYITGRRGYQEGGGDARGDACEIFTAAERDKLEAGRRELICGAPLVKWLVEHCDILERGQVEVDPQYEAIRSEALACFDTHQLEVAVPLVVKGQVNAILGLGKKENLRAYSAKDLELLKKLGQEAGVTVFNALHYEELAETERLEEEMRMGRQIQMMLLPREAPSIAGLNVWGMMEPAKEIGGDYYDFITLPGKGALSVVIGDVSGKGVGAGLLMAMAKTAIHTLSQEQTSPREILLRTNEILNQHVGGQKFMTMLYFMWRDDTKTLTYSSAGHEHILILRHQSQELEAIQSGGLMLGMIPDIDKFLEEKDIILAPKDKILLYTDGVTEALNQDQDRYGLDRLKESFKEHSGTPAQDLMNLIRDEVYAFIGTTPQYDDITLVVMEAS
ncbi:MAG: SpoIIE family protein phosphatase [Candidatus Omnitrophica bacterium]|nr:SpoIIE family protein phosphatase [Candidatus Omnitrophota bacterium]MDD5654858.1 SpoIIE family protein phosphatase [Candidatus Omnitrophota bacterium]